MIAVAWWFERMRGNILNAALSPGFSMCGSSAIAPLVDASRTKKNSRLSNST